MCHLKSKQKLKIVWTFKKYSDIREIQLLKSELHAKLDDRLFMLEQNVFIASNC